MEPIGYLLEPDVMETLRRINTQLYGDGRQLTPDARRDLANLMNVTLGRAMPVEKEA